MKISKIDQLDGIEMAWGIIANAYNGDWSSAPKMWKNAAEKWRDNFWHKILKSKSEKIYQNCNVYLDKPQFVKHATHSCGLLPDNTIINAYIFAKRGNDYLVYCATDCFYEVNGNGFVKKGCGFFIICKKSRSKKHKNLYIGKYEKGKIRGWRNTNEDIASFFHGFLLGNLDKNLKEEEYIYTNKQILSVCKNLDIIESSMAEKKLLLHRKKNK